MTWWPPTLSEEEQFVLDWILTFDIWTMMEPEDHPGPVSWKMLPFRKNMSGLKNFSFLFTYEDAVCWKWAELVESVEKCCKVGMFALWMRWDVWPHGEAQAFTKDMRPMNVSLWAEHTPHTHRHAHKYLQLYVRTPGPDVHVSLWTIFDFLQSLKIYLCRTTATGLLTLVLHTHKHWFCVLCGHLPWP